MASNITRLHGVPPVPAPTGMPSQQHWGGSGWRDGNWFWDGQRWVCDPCEGFEPCPPVPCPPCPPPWFSPSCAPWYPGANGGVSFSQNPPCNPCRGHFWWNGTILRMFDGAAWVDIGPTPADVVIGAQPPANPTVGELWFDGHQLWIWNGTAWVPTSAGGTAPGGGTMGVTDGSNAAPGVIGEFLEFSVNVQFPAYPGNVNTPVTVATIPPGDWDLQAACGPQGGNLRAIDFLLQPKPTGMNDAMRGTMFITVASSGMFCGVNDSVVVSQRSRGSFAVATPMVFTVILDNSGDPNSGASFVEMDMTARRMR